jgi:hypothetical protein
LIVPALQNIFNSSVLVDLTQATAEEETQEHGAKVTNRILTWLFREERGPSSDIPDGPDLPIAIYNATRCSKRVILASTNECVDFWNEAVAALNPEPEHVLCSDNVFSDVDDDKGHLARLLTERVLERYETSSVPLHLLRLKVGDICIILRNINIEEGITNNTRVRVLAIHPRRVRVQTLEDTPRSFNLPRIHFKFKLPYGDSFELTRTQFPLRRAFAMTIHKSQGQTLDRVALDIRESAFAHGQTYVAISRVRNYQDISFIVTDANLTTSHLTSSDYSNEKNIVLQNVVYKEALRASCL